MSNGAGAAIFTKVYWEANLVVQKLILVVSKIWLTIVIRRLINSGLDRWGYFSNITSLGGRHCRPSAISKLCFCSGQAACWLWTSCLSPYSHKTAIAPLASLVWSKQKKKGKNDT